jgi:hypothetical protein
LKVKKEKKKGSTLRVTSFIEKEKEKEREKEKQIHDFST